MPRMLDSHVLRLGTFRQLLVRELAHRLQHAVARRISAAIEHDQMLVDEGEDSAQHIEVAANCHNRLGIIETPPTDEHAQAPEKDAVSVGEQVVTPGDGIAQRALPLRRVPGARSEKWQATIQAAQELFRWQRFDPRRRQFQGQGQPIEPMADGGDCRSISGGQCKVGRRIASTFHEQGHCRVLLQVIQTGVTGEVWQRQRKDRKDALSSQAEGLAAGGQQLGTIGASKQIADDASRFE
jgi:hypothetical protein